jgi:hypothetical protein
MARNYLCYAFIDGSYLHFVICLDCCDMQETIYAIVDMHFVICLNCCDMHFVIYKKIYMLLLICIL